jgi:hypothetical protein
MFIRQRVYNHYFNPDKLLPLHLRIEHAGDRLYRRGITPIRSDFFKEPNRHKLIRLIVSLIVIFTISRFAYFAYIYSTKTNDQIDERFASVYFGDFSYHLPSIRVHWAIMGMNFNCFSLLTFLLHQILYFKENYQEKFQWLQIFDVLNGKMIPAMLGLLYEEDIKKLAKRYQMKIRCKDELVNYLL